MINFLQAKLGGKKEKKKKRADKATCALCISLFYLTLHNENDLERKQIKEHENEKKMFGKRKRNTKQASWIKVIEKGLNYILVTVENMR